MNEAVALLGTRYFTEVGIVPTTTIDISRSAASGFMLNAANLTLFITPEYGFTILLINRSCVSRLG